MLVDQAKLENKIVTVELKSGIYFTGRLVGADSYLNVRLDQLVFQKHEDYGYMKDFKEVFVRGDKIKFITYKDEHVLTE